MMQLKIGKVAVRKNVIPVKRQHDESCRQKKRPPFRQSLFQLTKMSLLRDAFAQALYDVGYLNKILV